MPSELDSHGANNANNKIEGIGRNEDNLGGSEECGRNGAVPSELELGGADTAIIEKDGMARAEVENVIEVIGLGLELEEEICVVHSELDSKGVKNANEFIRL